MYHQHCCNATVSIFFSYQKIDIATLKKGICSNENTPKHLPRWNHSVFRADFKNVGYSFVMVFFCPASGH